MKSLRWGVMWAVVGWLTGGFCGRDAAAQSLGDPPASAAAAGVGEASGGAMTTTPVPLFSPTVPSVTASAAGASAQGGIMSSPFAAPFLYSSMYQATQPLSASSSTVAGTTSGTGSAMGMSTAQLGMLMLATQRRPGGVGSGQYTGMGQSSSPQTTAVARTPATSKQRTAARPGGLAARYFNRVGTRSAYPQRYFNRQSRYFP